jgi:hypothetical protein
MLLDIVVQACNPSYLVGNTRRIIVQGQPRQKLKTQSKKLTKEKQNGWRHGSSGGVPTQ